MEILQQSSALTVSSIARNYPMLESYFDVAKLVSSETYHVWPHPQPPQPRHSFPEQFRNVPISQVFELPRSSWSKRELRIFHAVERNNRRYRDLKNYLRHERHHELETRPRAVGDLISILEANVFEFLDGQETINIEALESAKGIAVSVAMEYRGGGITLALREKYPLLRSLWTLLEHQWIEEEAFVRKQRLWPHFECMIQAINR